MGRVTSHIRANVVGYAALFVALSGTAWAATEIERNEVASKHLRNAGVKGKDLAPNAVTSPKVRDASLRAADFGPGELPQGDRGPQGEPGPRGEQGPPGPPGRDGILDAVGRSTASPGGLCAPDGSDSDPDPLECVSTSLQLPRAARVHLVASADWGIYGSLPYAGECRLAVNGVPIPDGPVTHPGETDYIPETGISDHTHVDFIRGETGLAAVDHLAQLALTHVTQPMPAGTYRFGLVCHDTDGAIMLRNESISAVAISPN